MRLCWIQIFTNDVLLWSGILFEDKAGASWVNFLSSSPLKLGKDEHMFLYLARLLL